MPRTASIRRPRGFTLLELIVVVTILAILMGVVAPRLMSWPGEARKARARTDMKAIATALQTYHVDNFKYPSTQQGIEALVRKPSGQPDAPNWKTGGYLGATDVPKDPWNRPYLYISPGQGGREFDVYTLGADGKPGGEDEDADLGHWMQ
jgi:general secretion pathway protein G